MLGAAVDRLSIGFRRIAAAPAHAARRRAVLGGEIGGGRFRFVIGDQVDVPLTPEFDVLRAVARDAGETHAFEHRFELPLFGRSEEHTSELQSLMRISYAVFCLKKKKIIVIEKTYHHNRSTI